MSTSVSRDFGSILNELLQERDQEPDRAHLVSIDYLSVVEELHSGRITFSEEMVQDAYRLFASAQPATPKKAAPEPSVDPDEIARELGLSEKKRPKELDRLRRDFAFRNHPDRVPEHLRARAIIRMQVANMLIDEAKNGRVKMKRG